MSGSSIDKYKLKIAWPGVKKLFDISPILTMSQEIIPIKEGSGKPAPDIFLPELKAISSLQDWGDKIEQAECHVFEDFVSGVEAGRREG